MVCGAVRVALTLTVPRPLRSVLPKSCSGDNVCTGTGFWPGAALPPLFVQVYVAKPTTSSWAVAGFWLPRPLISPVAVTVSPEKVTSRLWMVAAPSTVVALSASRRMAAMMLAAARERRNIGKSPSGVRAQGQPKGTAVGCLEWSMASPLPCLGRERSADDAGTGSGAGGQGGYAR